MALSLHPKKNQRQDAALPQGWDVTLPVTHVCHYPESLKLQDPSPSTPTIPDATASSDSYNSSGKKYGRASSYLNKARQSTPPLTKARGK